MREYVCDPRHGAARLRAAGHSGGGQGGQRGGGSTAASCCMGSRVAGRQPATVGVAVRATWRFKARVAVGNVRAAAHCTAAHGNVRARARRTPAHGAAKDDARARAHAHAYARVRIGSDQGQGQDTVRWGRRVGGGGEEREAAGQTQPPARTARTLLHVAVATGQFCP